MSTADGELTKAEQVYVLLREAMEKIEPIGKHRKNTQQNFKFRGIEDVYNEVHKVMVDVGLVGIPTIVSQETLQSRTTTKGGTVQVAQLVMSYRIVAPDGSSVEVTCPGEAMDSGDKATSKALSYAHRNALVQLFVIPYEGMPDPDADSYEIGSTRRSSDPVSPEKRAEARWKLIMQAWWNTTDGTSKDAAANRESMRQWCKEFVSRDFDYAEWDQWTEDDFREAEAVIATL